MSLSKREKTVVRNALEKLWGTKAASTNQNVKSALRIMQRESSATVEPACNEPIVD